MINLKDLIVKLSISDTCSPKHLELWIRVRTFLDSKIAKYKVNLTKVAQEFKTYHKIAETA
jgi:hypothetical protein